MSFDYQFPPSVDLHVADRISQSDAERQMRTVKSILERLKHQPGIILADEVGMGKTFVALGVAISVYLKGRRPTVIMIPPNLVNKWPGDFRLFCEACINDPKVREKLRCGIARRPEEFLKLLDDPEESRAAVIFLTHGALTRNLGDGWIKLAIIQRTLWARKDTADIYKALSQHAGALIEKQSIESKNRTVDIWQLLLNESPGRWKKILVKHGFFDKTEDDPVPEIFRAILKDLKSTEFELLLANLREMLPKRTSPHIKDRLRELRILLNEEAKRVWGVCLSKIRLQLPLLIFDEAHHLKNSQTQLVTKLFHDPVAEEEAGILAGQFDRMLFLTATPFQLGHHELHSVLERFTTINWNSAYAPTMTRIDYKAELADLLKQLDHSQIAARKLDLSWGKLRMEDLKIENSCDFETVYQWWCQAIANDPTQLPHKVQMIIKDYGSAKEKLKNVEALLKKYVIRHTKQKEMGHPYEGVLRRKNLPGCGIEDETVASNPAAKGLQVTKEAMLPFLLAARLTAIKQDERPVFAEGLASSFEAFRYTREQREKRKESAGTDADDEGSKLDTGVDPVVSWYLDQLDQALSNTVHSGSLHPKLKPTIDKAIELWTKGEKVLIFCHYIATAKALRKYLSREMRSHIKKVGARKYYCPEELVFDELEKVANRISQPGSPLQKICVGHINSLVDPFPELEDHRADITEAILRYMKTPSFLVRFGEESEEKDEDWLTRSFEAKDSSGISLKEMLGRFIEFLAKRSEDRDEYLRYLMSIQPGGIRAADVTAAFEDDEHHEETESTVMANVRLCYGATKHETRQKLMKTFNTPFFPDILVTSSVMAEGVDLHLNCRHIIHHDLSWNPSTLEQRTGRVDRIGAKAERCGQPICVYMPYLSETQDEKMYRVVTERERWFNIVMGEKYKVDAINTDKYAERIPLPEELANELSFKLEVE